MTTKRISGLEYIGLSTDTKPTDANLGATFLEYDTKCLFVTFDSGTTWVLKSPPLLPTKTTTIDLNQAAGDYTLFTVGGTDIEVLEIGIIIPADLTGAAAGSLTSISIQSTDASPVEFISATAGAKANLSSGAHLLYNGNGVVATTELIQLTIAGGATTAAQVCQVFMTYAGVV